MKIYIIGGAGSGKTYAAKKLSKMFNIPHFDLDDIYWDRKDKHFTKKTQPNIRSRKVNAIIKRKDWVIEGSYTKEWVQPVINLADEIIILRPNIILRQLRLLKRHVKRRFSKGKKESISGLLELLVWNQNYDKKDVPRLEKMLKRKTIKIYKKADQFLKTK